MIPELAFVTSGEEQVQVGVFAALQPGICAGVIHFP